MSVFLGKLKKMSNYPVEETNDEFNPTGWFIHLTFYPSLDGKIELNEKMLIHEKEGTLAHEMGHGRCHKRKCECYKSDNKILQEIHAELYALHILLRYHQKSAIKARFSRLRDSWFADPHNKAKDIIEKRRIYRRCQEFVKGLK